MRKGRNVGRYEMAEDRFFNESSERDYLYDDMMDAVSELIIGTLGNVYSRTDDWMALCEKSESDIRKRKEAAARRGTRKSLKCAIHKFLQIATDIEVCTFIDKYILRYSDKEILEMYGHDRVPTSPLGTVNTIGSNAGLIEIISNISNPEITAIKSVYDLEELLDADDYVSLVNVYAHRSDIRELEKFRRSVYDIAYKLCPYRSSNRIIFVSILERMPYYLNQISMDMYKEYQDILRSDMSICLYCDFLCKSMKYKWFPLTEQELTILRYFSVGTMDLFNYLKPGVMIINGLDVAVVLNKEATIDMLAHDTLENNATRSYDMFRIYDSIHSALDPDYVQCETQRIEDVYGVNMISLQGCEAMLKQAVESTDFVLALNRYMKSIRKDLMISKFNIHLSDYEELLTKSYDLKTERQRLNLLDVLITIDTKYLAELRVEKDIRILITVFYNLVKICKVDHELYKNITPENSFNVLLALSILRFIYDSTPCTVRRGKIERVLCDSINNSNDNYREIIIRLMNSLSTRNFSIIDDDISIVKKYYCTNK